jgi:hypothetical protein
MAAGESEPDDRPWAVSQQDVGPAWAPGQAPATAGIGPGPEPGALPRRLAALGDEAVAWFKTLASAAIYATLIVTFGFQVARVEGQSMAPTLEDQDRLIVNKLAYRLSEPRAATS